MPIFGVPNAQGIIDKTVKQLEMFADKHKFVVDAGGTILADGSIMIEGKFSEFIGRTDELLMFLGEEIQGYRMFKVSLIPIFDLSTVVNEPEVKGNKVIMGKRSYDLYQGHFAAPMNFSSNVAAQFMSQRFGILDKLRQLTGQDPSMIRVVMHYGDTVMGTKIPRSMALKSWNTRH